MWRFQTAAGSQGSQGAPGPAMAAESLAAAQSCSPSRGAEPPGDSMTSGRQRRGIPGLYQALLSGRSGHLKAGTAAAQPKPSVPEECVSVPGVSSRDYSLPDACGRVQGGASRSPSLTSQRLDQCQKLRMQNSLSSPGRGDPATSPGLYRDKHQAQAL